MTLAINGCIKFDGNNCFFENCLIFAQQTTKKQVFIPDFLVLQQALTNNRRILIDKFLRF